MEQWIGTRNHRGSILGCRTLKIQTKQQLYKVQQKIVTHRNVTVNFC